MVDPPTSPGANGDGAVPRRGLPPRTPGWVKAFGIIAIVLVLVLVILHLTGHGPGGHTSHSGLGERGARQP